MDFVWKRPLPVYLTADTLQPFVCLPSSCIPHGGMFSSALKAFPYFFITKALSWQMRIVYNRPIIQYKFVTKKSSCDMFSGDNLRFKSPYFLLACLLCTTF